MFESQSQSASGGSLAIQAQGNVNVGLSYQDVRQVALDVYQANFPTLVAEAAQVARARAEEFTDKFLQQLHAVNPTALSQAIRPDFQNALFNAQKEHACAGDADLADLLVDLLVDRTKVPQRGLMQLVLDEALKTAPKLTERQLAVLGSAFLLRYTRSTAETYQGAIAWMQEFLSPVISEAQVTPSTLQHLEFTGCGTVNTLLHSELAAVFREFYAAYFQTGLTQEEIATQTLSAKGLAFIKTMPDQVDKMRVAILSDEVIAILSERGAFGAEDVPKLKQLLNLHLKSVAEVKAELIAQLPFFQKAVGLWEEQKLGQLSLTSVGMAIGHAYVKKTVKKEFASLDVWIK